MQERYAELVCGARRAEDVAYRPKEKTLPPKAILAELAELMECDTSAFSTRAHGQPHRPFAAHFLTRYGGLSRRIAADHLGVRSGPAVSRQLALYGEPTREDRRLKKLAAVCENAFRRKVDEL